MSESWRELLVDGRQINPADLAASRIDFPAWLATLPPRSRAIAEALAAGDTTGDVAARFGVTPARVSQLRRKFERDWDTFHGGLWEK